MSYEKDILLFLRMNSNPCINEILADARVKSANADEIFGFASDEIKSTHPPSRRISSNEVGFHRRRRFHPPIRVDLVEKPTSRNLSVFLAGLAGFEPTSDGVKVRCLTAWLQPNIYCNLFIIPRYIKKINIIIHKCFVIEDKSI